MTDLTPKKLSDGKVLMPAGVYYMGDPCYAIDDDKWHDYLHTCLWSKDTEHVFEELPVLAFGTMYGDGCYQGSNGEMYGVDAGLIGVVHEKLVVRERAWELGTKFVSEVPFECWNDEDTGMMTFGSVSIMTGDDDTEDEDCDMEDTDLDNDGLDGEGEDSSSRWHQ